MSVLCGLPFATYIWSACAAPAPLAVGYVEGDYVMLAPIEVAQVAQVEVHRGQTVEAGAEVARLEDTDARIAVSQAEAALSQARAQLADLKLGKRPEEIAVLEAAVRSAEAQLREAQRTLARVEDLSKRGIATQAQLDQATTSNEMAEAQLGQAKANLAVAGLAAREEAIKAAESQVEQAQATLDSARWRLTQRVIAAPSAGQVSDVIRNAGDIAGPSAPVVSLMPDGAVKLKLNVPEEAFSSVKVGDTLRVRCDGCPPGLSARVSYVSPEPEFTPPVIYSIETRQKLVYLVEARPEEADTRLQPGQIVDVELGQ